MIEKEIINYVKNKFYKQHSKLNELFIKNEVSPTTKLTRYDCYLVKPFETSLELIKYIKSNIEKILDLENGQTILIQYEKKTLLGWEFSLFVFNSKRKD